MGIREKYWKYSLFVLILGLGVVIFMELIPFMSGILGAATIYVLVKKQMRYLCERRRWRRSLAATLILVESVVIFLIPVSLTVWMFVKKIQSIALDPQAIIAPIEHLAETIRLRTGYDLLETENLPSMLSLLPRVGQWLMGSLGSFGLNVFVLVFVLYFMLIGGQRMESYFRDILPFNPRDTDHVMHEMNLIVRSNAIGIPLLAIVQGVIAYCGYLLFQVPSPLFFGVLTCFATVIPIVGTALVWAPLAIYLAAMGDWGNAIGLSLFALIVVTHVDNLVRFIMQKKMADTHPLVTIFGVVIGLSLFGFMGVIFGPLLLSIFIFCMHLFKVKYLGHKV